MKNRATILAVSYIGVCRSKLLELAEDFDSDASIISDWLEDGYPDDPESVKAVGKALTDADAGIIELATLTTLMAAAVRAAAVEATPPRAEVA